MYSAMRQSSGTLFEQLVPSVICTVSDATRLTFLVSHHEVPNTLHPATMPGRTTASEVVRGL